MTENVEKTKSVWLLKLSLIAHGGLKTNAGQLHILLLLKPFVMGLLSAFRACDAAMRNRLPTMRTTTSRWMLCGYASHAMSNGTKNY